MEWKLSPERLSELETVFLSAEYTVYTPGWSLRIGEQLPALSAFLAEKNLDHWAFLTAWNPGSEILPEEENIRRNAELALDLADYLVLEGEGGDPNHNWEPEISFWVGGISQENALMLARKYGQLAIVAAAKEDVAQLLWTGLWQ